VVVLRKVAWFVREALVSIVAVWGLALMVLFVLVAP